MREIITTGKTVQDAIDDALNQLGLTEDDVTIDILQLPQKKLFKSIPAKVKVSVDEVELPKEKPVEKIKPQVEKQSASKIVKEEKVQTPKAIKPSNAPKAVNTVSEKPVETKKSVTENDNYKEEIIDINTNETLKSAQEYLTDICAKMGADGLEFSAVKRGESYIVKIDGEKAGFLIGYRGETMDALGYLASLYVNRGQSDYLRINIDINNYRSKREDNLVALAHKIGAKVLKTGHSKTLEPMNPYERRILHSVIMEIKGIKSESIGEGSSRRVCIMVEGDSVKKHDRPRNNRGRSGAGRNDRNDRNDRGGDRGRKTSTPGRNFANKQQNAGQAPTAPKRTQTINDSDSLPLYGKIEL